MSAKVFYRLAAILALAYLVVVIMGLIRVRGGAAAVPAFGDIGEFLLVLGATAAFVAGLAIDERHAHRDKSGVFAAMNEHAERYAMLVAYLFVCIVIVQEVIRRFVLNYSSAWAQETAQYLFIYLGYIGAAFAVKERAHIRFDVLLNRVGPRAKAGLYIFAEITTITFAVIATYWSLHTVGQLLKFGGTTPVLRINKAWFEIAVSLGFTLVVFRSVQALLRDWRDLQAGRAPFAGKAMFEE
jgi:TRAP-type C4-dicarboxylate transport system permease small subunit